MFNLQATHRCVQCLARFKLSAGFNTFYCSQACAQEKNSTPTAQIVNEAAKARRRAKAARDDFGDLRRRLVTGKL